MVKSAINQFDITPGNNTDCDGVGVGSSMTVDNTNDAFQHLMALMAQQIGEVGALGADTASASTTSLSAVRGWFANITGTNTISSFGTGVPAGKIFHLRMTNGLTLTYNATSMILPNATNLAVGAGDVVTMLSLGSGNWRLLNSVPASGSALPPGTMVDFGGTTAPGGWLLCNGQAVSRTGYPLLYATISTLYGVGDGSTTFNVPDFRGRTALGNDTMGSSAAGRITTATVATPSTNGGSGGAQTHTLTTAQLPSHAHTASCGGESTDHSHYISGNTAGFSVNHTHTYVRYNSLASGVEASGGSGTGFWKDTVGVATDGASADHSHGIGFQSGGRNVGHTHAITVDAAGSGSAHNILQPSLVCTKLIKT